MEGIAKIEKSTWPVGSLRDVISRLKRRTWVVIDDLLRWFMMAVLLQYAARFLSRDAGLRVARWCGSFMLRSPASSRNALATMRNCFCRRERDARDAAREYLALPFYSHLIFARVLSGRESPAAWKIREENKSAIEELRSSDRPFIIATGHFRREGTFPLFSPRVCPGHVSNICAPLAPPSLHPSNLRERAHWGQLIRVMREAGVNLVPVGETMLKVVGLLKRPNHRLVMSIDAFWGSDRSAFKRPFTGMCAHPFSTGTAALGRLAQCPIVPCATHVDGDGTIVIEWGSVILPPAPHDRSADRRHTDSMLDFLESVIGRWPTQYALYIGEERRWNHQSGVWENSSDPVVSKNIG
jgi:lauroyl/myristoyl acyltransferase